MQQVRKTSEQQRPGWGIPVCRAKVNGMAAISKNCVSFYFTLVNQFLHLFSLKLSDVKASIQNKRLHSKLHIKIVEGQSGRSLSIRSHLDHGYKHFSCSFSGFSQELFLMLRASLFTLVFVYKRFLINATYKIKLLIFLIIGDLLSI